ncbi:MAG: efflux RND transporter permease subunit [Planctomycetaceae bacterium]|nr:MAG: efflux RND transporter permease subunit [Planctomycetaceae bacterium]
MLSLLIRFSLRFRLLIVSIALGILVLGGYVGSQLSIDVLPNLTRPRVIVISECPGMAPEEVETRVTIPIENALNGATDVLDIRSTSDIGLSVVQVEFDWGQDIYRARQIVQERLATATDRLPTGVQPQLAPIASLLGQILLIGMWSEDGTTGPLELRTQADWVVGQRLRAIRGVSQVITMGGGRRQIQVLVDLHKMHTYEISLGEIERALLDANLNVTGGFVTDGAQELLVRGLGLIQDPATLGQVVVRPSARRPVLLKEVARIVEGPQAKRGDSSVDGRSAIVLTIQKQPDADTRRLTEEIVRTLEELRPSLPPDVVIRPTYLQRDFIDLGIANVIGALRDGSILVVIVLFAFLLNLRTTLITLVAIPLSLAVTAIVFYMLGLGINVMTLGGLAVGLGMLVDDAIVGVENAYRRLRERLLAGDDETPLGIVYEATVEVLGAIVISTVIVVIVFLPLFTLAGMEGRLFTPLAIAYLVSIVASTVVALTVTPALSLILLPASAIRAKPDNEGLVLQGLKKLAAPVIRFSLNRFGISLILAAAAIAVIVSAVGITRLGRDFLPAFDEGATQVNLYSAPGTSLDTMVEISRVADERFAELLRTEEHPNRPLANFTCKLGRAEQDEHIMGVNVAEYVMSLNPESNVTRPEMIRLLTEAVEDLPGVEHEIEQPIAHLISHMLSGVAAQIAIKIHGDDLDVLRRKAEEVRRAIEPIPGIADPFVEQQQTVPQLRFEIDYDALARYGIAARELTHLIETAMHGRVVSQLTDGQRFFDILVRMEDEYRLDLDNLDRLPVEMADGSRVRLGALVKVERGGGPNTIQRENARRRIVIRVNTLGGDLSGVVEQIRAAVAEQVAMPEGYYVSYGGQFEARQSAQRQILWFSLVSSLVVFAILYSAFPATRIVLQILAAVPAAFVGGVAALELTGQSLSIAAMVGFVSLGGIATRNGLLLVSTYQNLIPKFGMSPETILRGSLDRLAPVLMSALTTGLGLLPLVIGGTQPGKEILYPVATVIVGGLISSTLCEFLLRPGLFWFTRRW